MIRRPPRSTLSSSSAASDVYKRQLEPAHERVPEVPWELRSGRAKSDSLLGDDIPPRRQPRRSIYDVEKTETQPLTGVQGQGRPGGRQGRRDPDHDRREVRHRRSPSIRCRPTSSSETTFLSLRTTYCSSTCPRTQDTKPSRPRPEALRPPAGVVLAAGCAGQGAGLTSPSRPTCRRGPSSRRRHSASGWCSPTGGGAGRRT